MPNARMECRLDRSTDRQRVLSSARSVPDTERSGESSGHHATPAMMLSLTAREEARALAFPIGESAIRGDIDCSCVDVLSSLSLANYMNLRKRYCIPESISILRPLADDLSTRPRKGYAAIHEASLRGGVRLPFQSVIQDLLVRLGLHASQMSPFSTGWS